MKQSERNRKGYGDGHIFQRGKNKIWYARYYSRGQAYTERCLTEGGEHVKSRNEAEIFLRRKLNEVGAGTFISPQVRNLRVQTLWDSLEAEYKQNGRQLTDIEARWRLHLGPFFGGRKIETITHDEIVQYREARLREGARSATVNRECALLHRMFVLARRAGKIRELPSFPQQLREDNVRTGFVEDAQFRKIMEGVRELWFRALLVTLYHVGDRRGELIPTRRHPNRGLRVRQVELHNGLIRLDTKTKTGKARVLPITFDMRPLLEACVFGKEPNDYVFTADNGNPVDEDLLRSAWSRLTQVLGLGSFVPMLLGKADKKREVKRWKPSLLIHDFRRSATRNLIQRGVSQTVAMSISGHATDSVFRRYQIVSEADILEAGAKISSKPVVCD